jgi:hypothetical protein
MKIYQISKAKILNDIFSILVGAAALQILSNFFFAPELFQNPRGIIISITFFALMMLSTYLAFTYAGPTITFIEFADDHFVLKLIRGHKKISYSEIKSIKHKGFGPNNTKLCIGDEKLRLVLQFFTKNDRAEIIKTLIDKTNTI